MDYSKQAAKHGVVEDTGKVADEKGKDKVVEAEKGKMLRGFQRGSWCSRCDDWTSTANVLRGPRSRTLGAI